MTTVLHERIYLYVITIPERFQSKALRMVVLAPWYVPNTVIRKDLQTTVKEEIRRYSYAYSFSLQRTPKQPSSESRGATRQQQATAKTPAK
jgi:hypothetical protein